MERIRDIIISVLFLAFIGGMAVCYRADERFLKFFTVGRTTEAEEPAVMEQISADLLNKVSFKSDLVELSGYVMKGAGVRSYYNNTLGINITRDGYNIGRYDKTSTDYEVEQMKEFKKYLDSKGIRLLYVNEPAKYVDDKFYTSEFGGESYLNRNMDLFLSRIEEAGIDYIDLRENIKEEQLDSLSLFYRTDHHWTVPASKWAAEIIAERLNESYDYDIDMSLYDDKNYNIVEYKNAWLGEQGRKVAKSYIGLDDYTMMEPNYETSYEIVKSSDVLNGDFELFINKNIYNTIADPYKASSWHYSYQNYHDCLVQNKKANYGNVLLLGDSYESSMMPFLTLGIKNIRLVIPRNIGDRSIHSIIEEGDYDTVIMSYAQFMVGAHDNENSANYRMFTLE